MEISHICNKIAKTTGIQSAGHARHYLPRIVIRGLCNAFIYPYLSYGNIAWGDWVEACGGSRRVPSCST